MDRIGPRNSEGNRMAARNGKKCGFQSCICGSSPGFCIGPNDFGRGDQSFLFSNLVLRVVGGNFLHRSSFLLSAHDLSHARSPRGPKIFFGGRRIVDLRGPRSL